MKNSCNFFPCLFPLIWFFIIAGVAIAKSQETRTKQASWENLARRNNLTFVPGSWFGGGAYVYGNYRGYRLRLETFGQNKQTYTRIVLSVPADQRSLPHQNFELRDSPMSVSEVTRWLVSKRLPLSLSGELRAEAYGWIICHEQAGVVNDEEYLQSAFGLMVTLIESYPQVLILGGDTVPALQEIAKIDRTLKPIVVQLLYDIGHETTLRLGGRAERLFCPNCFACFSRHAVRLSWWQTITYYGCRGCGQSRKFLNSSGDVVVVLDKGMDVETFHQNGALRVNWLQHRHLFDFDSVEIVHATDEEVERFAVQVGNDTDPQRQPRYARMRCVVSPECRLSENTRRILARMFGAVEIGD